jgi:hypothetical protein
MKQIPSSEVDSSSANQRISHVLWNKRSMTTAVLCMFGVWKKRRDEKKEWLNT